MSKGIYMFLPCEYVYLCIYVILELHDYISRSHTRVYDNKGKIVFSHVVLENWLSMEDKQVCVYLCTHPCIINMFEFSIRISFTMISKIVINR